MAIGEDKTRKILTMTKNEARLLKVVAKLDNRKEANYLVNLMLKDFEKKGIDTLALENNDYTDNIIKKLLRDGKKINK